MKRVFDPSFKYTSSLETDLHKTFDRIRREQRAAARRAEATPASKATVVQLPREAGSQRNSSSRK